MSILCISDIQWEFPERNIQEVLKREIVDKNPSLVLFAGDVINDGMNSEEHTTEFIELLEYLEELEITSFTIEGNHDEYSNYSAVVERCSNLEYAKEISAEVAEFDDLRILGVPYSYTHQLGKARRIGDEFPGNYDIVLAHAESSKRIWLFELDTQLIVTGHFATELCQVDDYVFASMSSYPSQRVVIKSGLSELLYQRRSASVVDSRDEYESVVRLVDDGLVWVQDDEEPDNVLLNGMSESNYADNFERLIAAKNSVREADENEERRIIEGLLECGVPKTHIREYIKRYDFL
jgi:predicted phosphodiesterase